MYHKKHNLIVWEGTSYENYFRNALPETVMDKLWNERMRENPDSFVSSQAEGLNRLLDSDKNVYFGPTVGVRGILNLQLKNISCDVRTKEKTRSLWVEF